VNPLLRDELAGYRYYWATHQAEYATAVLFTSRTALRPLYARLLRHATLCLRISSARPPMVSRGRTWSTAASRRSLAMNPT
jgi:hypothetical protein